MSAAISGLRVAINGLRIQIDTARGTPHPACATFSPSDAEKGIEAERESEVKNFGGGRGKVDLLPAGVAGGND